MFTLWRVQQQIHYRKHTLLQTSFRGKMKINSSDKNNRVKLVKHNKLCGIWKDQKETVTASQVGALQVYVLPSAPINFYNYISGLSRAHTHTHKVTEGSNAQLSPERVGWVEAG